MYRLGLTAMALAAMALACPPPAVEPPHTETVSLERVCSHLRELGCEEGDDTDEGVSCEQALRSMQRLVRVDTACLADAASVDAVRACGGVRCL